MLIFGDKQFDKPCQVITAFNAAQLRRSLSEIEAQSERRYLAGYIRYEAKEAFAGGADGESERPLLYFEAFDGCQNWTARTAASPVHLEVRPSLYFDEYRTAIAAIKNEIKNGTTYEVNYTYDFIVDAGGADDFELFEYLLPYQKTPFNAFITNRWETVLSFSPELFFELRESGGTARLVARPMKGTVRRGRNEAEDAALKAFLASDIKNRAENVMIVDLLRNDLGRIARFGSVRVNRLFDIETHPTVHQMTSEIEAEARSGVTLFNMFSALFPCGSITGAPKISTMEIIGRTEKGRRDIYCGAIGLLSPPEAGAARQIWSVPIRILQRTAAETRYRYRAGGAVVWDSSAEDEWKETITKARFLQHDFCLLETMRVEGGAVSLAREHLERLRGSARYFGFRWNSELEELENRAAHEDGILRLLLAKNGSFRVEHKPLVPDAGNAARFSPLTVDSADIFLYHKTNYRPLFHVDYTRYYDEIFCNERGELTEGSRTNILLELAGELWTPPLTSGLLNGIMRQKLLAEGRCQERILTKADALSAQRILCVNSVRGIKEITLEA